MGQTTPLKFDFDDTTPSALAEFTSVDVVPVLNGGTGVSSLAEFGGSLVGTSLSAHSLSATVVNAIHLSATAASAITFSAVTLSANTINTVASSISVSACPLPLPFSYVQLTNDGSAAAAEVNIGAGSTNKVFNSDSADIVWNSTADYFTIKKPGYYEVVARVVLEVATTTVVTLNVKTGSATVQNTFAPKINSAVDPQEATLHAVFTAAANDNILVTHKDDASTNVNAGAGTTLMIKRIM